MLLWIELIVIFIILPLVIAFKMTPIPPIVFLFFSVIYALWIMKKDLKNLKGRDPKRRIRILAEERWFAIRFFAAAALLFFGTWFFIPEKLFSFIRERTQVFILIAFLYPVFSVLPQEFLYRAFFFKRYQKIIKNEVSRLWISSAVFGFLHIVYLNPIAIVLSFFGGYLFAHTYHRTKSILPVVVEHYLYGMLIFAIGLGDFFYLNLNILV